MKESILYVILVVAMNFAGHGIMLKVLGKKHNIWSFVGGFIAGVLLIFTARVLEIAFT